MKFATTLLKDTIKQVRVELLNDLCHSQLHWYHGVILVPLSNVTNTASTHTEIIDIFLTQASDNLIALYDGKILVQALVLEWEYP